MSEARESPLAHLALADRAVAARGAAGVSLRERPFRAMVTLRGDVADAVQQVVGSALPTEPLTSVEAGGRSVLWLGPDEWLVVAPAELRAKLPQDLTTAVADRHAAVVETGESMSVIEVAGPRAVDVLRKGCAIDLHPRAFRQGRVVRTLLAKSGIVLHRTDTATYEVYVHRSFADYLWRWLEDAGQEYGVAVLAP